MTQAARQSAPPRGTRPRNRRALILDAAASLFYGRGYSSVGVGDIAEAVAIAPSALYRHFSGKQQLLAEVIADRIARLGAALDGDGALLPSLAAAALDHRETGVLWQREGRHLTPEGREAARAGLRAARERLAVLVRERRPELEPAQVDLLARAASSLLSSPSYHHLELPRAAYEELLETLLADLVGADLPEIGTEVRAASTPGRVAVRSRREGLLNHAIVMFAEHGYAAVTMEDVAARVGITGANIYTYFPSKADLLVSGFRRGYEWLHRDLVQAVELASDHRHALQLLVKSYAEFTFANSQLIDLLITELGSLPDDEQASGRQLQHDYIDEWVHLLLETDPALGAVPARIRLQAWFTVVNDVARSPRLRDRPGVVEAVEAIGAAMLTRGSSGA